MSKEKVLKLIRENAKSKNPLLDLRGLEIDELPPDIGILDHLRALRLGAIPDTNKKNNLTTLPRELCQLTNLELLELSDNKIKELPKEIGQLKNLTELYLNRNEISELPNEITELNKLILLELIGNNLSLPDEILDYSHQPKVILNYYFENVYNNAKYSEQTLNEVKVFLVGEAGVGKTSLALQLMHESFPKNATSTQGIDISKFSLPINESKTNRQNSVQLNVWDFGGQEMYHATHQFFFTKRSLYLVVVDASRTEKENRLEYWLKMVESFAGDSPVIVVISKADMALGVSLNERSLKDKYTNIQGFVRTSVLKKPSISKLRMLIASTISRLPDVFLPLSRKWIAIKNQLEAINANYINYEDYLDICLNTGVTDTASQQTLITFLNELGTVIYLPHQNLLKNFVIINPNWIVNGVYRILSSNEIFQNNGFFDLKTLETIFDNSEYQSSFYPFLIAIMRTFEIAFELSDGNYLLPSHLPVEPPIIENFPPEECISFCYQYEILPLTIFTRFFVRVNRRILENLYWRNGVAISYNDNKALIIADLEESTITIFVKGDYLNNSAFLTLIRTEFKDIHDSFPGLHVTEKIGIPKHPGIFVRLDDLLAYEQKGMNSYFIPKLNLQFNVKELLTIFTPQVYSRKLTSASLSAFDIVRKETKKPRVGSLDEVKVLLVGEGDVGKTSLLRQIVHKQEAMPGEPPTVGIYREKFYLPVIPANTSQEHNVQLNIWDFGGQEIYHATHQFFLTKRSLYLVVVDARRGENESRLEYWLKIVESFGGDSSVIVVVNKIDTLPSFSLDERGLANKFRNIKQFINTSCTKGDGITDLLSKIRYEIGAMEDVFLPFSSQWFTVKTILEEKAKDFVTYEDYIASCVENGIKDEQSQQTLIGFLHRLGIVLYYQESQELSEMGVLNPEWVTNGVYQILKSEKLKQNNGILTESQLPEILSGVEYGSISRRHFIMKIMKKFELCFPFDSNSKYLIPDLLPKEEPSHGFKEEGTLVFQYHYDVLPQSVISRFIVRMHEVITPPIYWRKGVLLDDGWNQALVRADLESKKIFIFVDGATRTRRDFLSRIRAQFEHIHKSIESLQVQEKVALPNQLEITVSYKYLLELEDKGRKQVDIEGVKDPVNLQRLLNGFESADKRRERRINNKAAEHKLLIQQLDKRGQELDKRHELLNHQEKNQVANKNNPWTSGSFYLVAYVVVTATIIGAIWVISIIAANNPYAWGSLPIILIAGLLGLISIGALQLKNDARYKDEEFTKLMIEVVKRVVRLGKSETSSLPPKDDQPPK